MNCVVCHSDIIRPFCKKNGYEVSRCATCLLLFVGNITVPAETYETGYFSSDPGSGYVEYDADKEGMKKAFQTILRDIRRQISKEKPSLLDVGAATGYFVAEASNAGFLASGIEVSSKAVAEAQARGRNVTQAAMGSLSPSFLHKQYDVVTLWDVIEHIPDFRKAVEEAYTLLVPGGILLINTPNAGSIWARIFGVRWHSLVPPEHVVWFNGRNLRMLLSEYGFRVENIRTFNKSFTLQYILNMLYRWQGLRIWRYFLDFAQKHPRIGRYTIPVPIGDNMLLIAIKHDQKH